MITKGTREYKKAQDYANTIQMAAQVKRTEGFWFTTNFDKLGSFLQSIIELNIFASQVAKTIDNSLNPYGYQVANISSKQAWILACAAVENNIEEIF